MKQSSSWQRPKTTRRYIHPPRAERMYTLWAEGKLILGHIDPCIDWRSYKNLECHGLWLVYGKEDRQFDFRKVQNQMNPRGIPVHGLQYEVEGLTVELETFCDISRKPTCFVQLTFTNPTETRCEQSFAWLLRSGKEKQLAFATPDEYASYAPDVAVWKQTPADWYCPKAEDPLVVINEDAFWMAKGAEQLQFCPEEGALRFTVKLQPGESQKLQFALGQGKALDFDYEQEKRRCLSFWERELSRLNALPEAIRNHPEKRRMVENLTVHMLQCFCYPVGKSHIMPRQGGMQRLIWPWESMPVLEALSRLGDFSDYVEEALSTYFDVLQAPDGEIRPAGEGWACITGSVLYSFATYVLHAGKRCYDLYRENALSAMEWIRRKRQQSCETSGMIPGLFPVMRGCDWDYEFQSWMTTDSFNVMGLQRLAEAAEYCNDPKAKEIRDFAQEYWQSLRSVADRWVKEAGDSDEIFLPLNPEGDDTELRKRCYPDLYYGVMAYAGYVDPENVPRIKNNWVARGNYCNDLYGHMLYEDGNTHIWYTSIPDYYWFKAWLALGDRKQAEDIVNSQIRYSMTDEYYMIERYADNDPYFVPWSPNASANGRTLLMLLDLAAEEEPDR